MPDERPSGEPGREILSRLRGNEFQVLFSITLCANSQRDVPASFIIGEEEQDIDINHLRAASFAEMNHGWLGTETIQQSFDDDG